MSVGKDSILRAANAEAKKTETKAEPVKPAEEVKAPAEVKEAPKAEAKEPAAKKTPARKPRATKAKATTAKKAAPKKTTTRKKSVKTSVLTPENSEELQKAFVKDKTPEEVQGSVQVNEELPVYLL